MTSQPVGKPKVRNRVDDWRGERVKKARAAVARMLPAPCGHCGSMVTDDQAWVVGHAVPRALRPDLADEPSNWRAEHRRCSDKTGAKVASLKRQAKAAGQDIPPPPPPPRTGRSKQTRHGDLRGAPLPGSAPGRARTGEVPPDNYSLSKSFNQEAYPDVPPPLHFPPCHPRAVRTRVGEFTTWLHETRGLPEGLRPWQHAVASRLLEVDEDGLWCWGLHGALLVVPRQQGKTTLMNLLATWMAHDQALKVLSAAPVLRQVWDLIQPTVDWLDDVDTDVPAKISRQTDRPSIRFTEGGRWSCQAATLRLGVGSSVDSALLDEVWDLTPDAVTRGLLPAMSAMPNPFLLMASTADVEGSALMGRWRAAAMTRPDQVALMEWGASAEADWRSVETWKAASPAWSPSRQRFLEAQVVMVPELDFRTQYLNQEPRSVGISGWLTLDGLGEAQPVPMGPVAAAMEEDGDGRWAVAWAWESQGRVHVRVQEVGSSLARAVESVASLRPTGVLVHRATSRRLREPPWPVTSVTQTDQLAATKAWEALVKSGRLAFSGSVLAEQARDARLGTTGALDRKSSQGPIHAVQAAVWAAYAAEGSAGTTPEVF